MESTDKGRLDCEVHKLNGALDAISRLREELELRLEEARDDCVRETLDNIITHVGSQIVEYQRRKKELSFS